MQQVPVHFFSAAPSQFRQQQYLYVYITSKTHECNSEADFQPWREEMQDAAKSHFTKGTGRGHIKGKGPSNHNVPSGVGTPALLICLQCSKLASAKPAVILRNKNAKQLRFVSTKMQGVKTGAAM
ncbi:uncharacterized protein LOC135369266 [Ornithodoros turicata]|uniref:uncharacterized protein LOC135369266 n=1 Tax=Ornithodoros turicata TaxID=34597 RepID=UPI003138CA9F